MSGSPLVKQRICPYCGQGACDWSVSSLVGAGSAEVRTSCGRALSVDLLLGKIRWHLEAATQAIQTMRTLRNPKK